MGNTIPITDARSLREGRKEMREAIETTETKIKDWQARMELPKYVDRRDEVTAIIISYRKRIGEFRTKLVWLERRC